MTKRDKIIQAAVNIEGSAVLLQERWDRALVGYTVPEGSRLVVGVYDYDKAVCRPFLVDLDTEDELIDALRSVDGEVKPIIIHSRFEKWGDNDKNYYRLKDDMDWIGEKKYNRVIYRTWWMVAVNLLLKILQPFTHNPTDLAFAQSWRTTTPPVGVDLLIETGNGFCRVRFGNQEKVDYLVNEGKIKRWIPFPKTTG